MQLLLIIWSNNSSNKGKLNKNSSSNIKLSNEQKNSKNNPFLYYQNSKKTNLKINDALNNLIENSAFSQTIKHLRNYSSQNEKNQSIIQKNKNNFTINKITVKTYNHSQGKNIDSSRENSKDKNSNRKNGIIGLEIRRIRKKNSKSKK